MAFLGVGSFLFCTHDHKRSFTFWLPPAAGFKKIYMIYKKRAMLLTGKINMAAF